MADGHGFRLKNFDPAETVGLTRDDKPRAKQALQDGVRVLADLQDRLYAQDRWALLLIFQAMDAAGKDGAIKKFFLHVSRREQRRRFLARLDDPTKNWKFSAADAAERRHWRALHAGVRGYDSGTATRDSPWHVVPADNKWFTRLVVAAAVAEALDSLDLHYPRTTPAQRKQLALARAALT